MSITNYSELQTSVSNWLHRSDLVAVIPDFITIAEKRMNADVQARDMDITTTLSTVAGVNTVTLPSDVVDSKLVQISSVDPKKVLSYMTLEKMALAYPTSTQTKPEAFAISGSSMVLAPIPDIVYTISYTYRQAIPALSDTNTTNWLLTKWPHAYLYAALCAAAPYLGADQRVQVWEQQYQNAVSDINSVDWYSGVGMSVRAV